MIDSATGMVHVDGSKAADIDITCADACFNIGPLLFLFEAERQGRLKKIRIEYNHP